mmetsp:Transcript_2658/g.357  ORF Transcript_2658/g.357 Transcript_2658/m.357 type:complete len:114 (+) Transcript_2658:64-405(+)
MLYELALSMQLPIVLMYWSIMAPDAPSFWDISDHGVWMLFIVIDFYFNNIKLQKNHGKFMGVVIVICLAINCIVSLADEPVYKVITYKNVMSYIYIAVLVGMVYGNFFFCIWL